ncbi:AraC family transcriptional regulator [Rubellicoccus peritrichatus]|uniref:AraC family transcriptional regulator n=1 Tax=Rubellicoccus peritrichatus TaxID=3080537 RepID=A0AAQ3LDG6_9BACT|nr:AraC family transcriptional regulator [Puniceicoccus sp. CR14]WOO43716.1 AraC family transcriptional regulator [Puniceicoccus sp. CR14]
MSRYLRLEVNHAVSGTQVWQGRNMLEENRIFGIRESGRKSGYILCHDTGQKFKMRTGHLYFMPSKADLEFEFNDDLFFSAIHFNIILFDGFDLFSSIQEISQFHDQRRYNERLQKAIEGEPNLQNIGKIKGIAFELISEFCPLTLQDLRRLEMIRSKYEKLFGYIYKHGNAATTVDELSGVSGMTRDNLSRSFSRDIGTPLKTWLNKELFRKAEQLLLQSNESSRSVADKLNFSSEYYFSRFFKKHSGIPPGEYQKRRISLLL